MLQQRCATQATGIKGHLTSAEPPRTHIHSILPFTLDGIKILAMFQVHLNTNQLTRQKET